MWQREEGTYLHSGPWGLLASLAIVSLVRLTDTPPAASEVSQTRGLKTRRFSDYSGISDPSDGSIPCWPSLEPIL